MQATRVFRYHAATIDSACEIMSALGVKTPADLHPSHIMRRMSGLHCATYADMYPPVAKGQLLQGTVPVQGHGTELQEQFNLGKLVYENGGKLPAISKSWRNASAASSAVH